jgi:hypothetical protein
MARTIKNSRIVPDAGTTADSADRAARRSSDITEALNGASSGRTQAEREAAKRALSDKTAN